MRREEAGLGRHRKLGHWVQGGQGLDGGGGPGAAGKEAAQVVVE